MSKTKDEIISNIYNDPAGYGSINNTYNDAKAKDKSIKIDDVKTWFEKNVNKKQDIRELIHLFLLMLTTNIKLVYCLLSIQRNRHIILE